MSGPVRLKIVRGIGLQWTTRVYRLARSGGRGPAGAAGPGLPADGTIGQMIRKSAVGDFITEWFDLFAQVAGFLNYTSPKLDLAPDTGETATIDYAVAGDYTIEPIGTDFILAFANLPPAGTKWDGSFYARNWDGITVTMPSGSATPGGNGLSFTVGGGDDRVVYRGNAGPGGQKEFYNAPGDMK